MSVKPGTVASVSTQFTPKDSKVFSPRNEKSFKQQNGPSSPQSGDVTTVMSLADRLKLALANRKPSKNTQSKRKLNENNRPKPSNQFKTKKLQSQFNSKPAPAPVPVSTISELSNERRIGNSDRSLHQQSESRIIPETNGNPQVLSLAERLAKRNKQTGPPRRPPPRSRKVAPSRPPKDRNEDLPPPTPRSKALSQRVRFKNINRNTNDPTSEDGRITVRKISDIPRLRLLPNRPPSQSGNVKKLKLKRVTSTTPNPKFAFIPDNIEVSQTPRTTKLKLTTAPSTTTFLPTTTTPAPTTTVQNHFACPELQCLDGKCISISQLNDGVVDCIDGSDEHDFGELVT